MNRCKYNPNKPPFELPFPFSTYTNMIEDGNRPILGEKCSLCNDEYIIYMYRNPFNPDIPHHLICHDTGQVSEAEEYLYHIRIWDGFAYISPHNAIYNINTASGRRRLLDMWNLEVRAATTIQRAWQEARLNPYCQLGRNKINRDYDSYLIGR
jgi:hypothetical protein